GRAHDRGLEGHVTCRLLGRVGEVEVLAEQRQALKKHRLSPARIVRQVLEELQHEHAGRQVEVRVANLPACEADPTLLRQVFANLISNAFKYTQAEPEPHIHMGYREKNGTPIYFVRDNGIGFDMQYAHKLFGVFQQLHLPGEYEGTGIGLALVKRILEKHGGRIWAEAEPGQGATFYFTLSQTPLPPVEFPIDI
ncbi:MAG: GHKL domain-containing protein, partial [Anaerolineales bacterium]|nr:GHKL domain-containing protein [Anaerolineales bacterium]